MGRVAKYGIMHACVTDDCYLTGIGKRGPSGGNTFTPAEARRIIRGLNMINSAQARKRKAKREKQEK